MPKVKVETKIINNKTKRKGKLGSSDRDKILADLKKHGIGVQEMREFLIGEGYHLDDVDEMVSVHLVKKPSMKKLQEKIKRKS